MRNTALMFVVTAALLTQIAPPAHADQAVTAGDLNVGIVGEQDFQAGYILIPRLPLFWESDAPWTMSLSSLDPDLGISNSASYVKPLGDLLWRLADEQVWLPVSQDPQEVTWSLETGSGVVYIDVMVLLDWLRDEPGEYHADIMFTVAPL